MAFLWPPSLPVLAQWYFMAGVTDEQIGPRVPVLSQLTELCVEV